jgi:hypothetical protein
MRMPSDWYEDVAGPFAQSHFAPAAMYWRAVVRYKASCDDTDLEKEAVELTRTYPSSVWAKKAFPWLATASKQRFAS